MHFYSSSGINAYDRNSLSFYSLYTLRQETLQSRLPDAISPALREAFDIIDMITEKHLGNNRYTSSDDKSSADYTRLSHPLLKWMLLSGSADNGRSSRFDEALDNVAALLVKVFGDKTVLSRIADMIFERNRSGLYYHDLIWAFFEAHDPYSLFYITYRLCSINHSDVRLALKLLGFIPFIKDTQPSPDSLQLYSSCQAWLYENLPFLYHTGESFQQTFNPRLYEVSWEAKYLCREVSAGTGEISGGLSENELKLLESFRTQSPDAGIRLADYSLKLNHKNIILWKRWISCPLSEQLGSAGMNGGGFL